MVRPRPFDPRRPARPLAPPAPAIDELDLPVYAIAAGSDPSGHGWDLEGVHSVTVRHDRVEITTQALRHALVEACHESAFALSAVI